MINDNSKEVYFTKVKPNLTDAQKSVIITMKNINRPATMEQIARVMQRQEHEVSGRFGELVKLKEIDTVKEIIKGKVVNKRVKNSKGNFCNLYEINSYKLF